MRYTNYWLHKRNYAMSKLKYMLYYQSILYIQKFIYIFMLMLFIAMLTISTYKKIEFTK